MASVHMVGWVPPGGLRLDEEHYCFDAQGVRLPAPEDVRSAPLDGVPPELFFAIALEARVSLSTVFAIAGGHTKSSCGKATVPNGHDLPIARVRAAAARVAGRR